MTKLTKAELKQQLVDAGFKAGDYVLNRRDPDHPSQGSIGIEFGKVLCVNPRQTCSSAECFIQGQPGRALDVLHFIKATPEEIHKRAQVFIDEIEKQRDARLKLVGA